MDNGLVVTRGEGVEEKGRGRQGKGDLLSTVNGSIISNIQILSLLVVDFL